MTPSRSNNQDVSTEDSIGSRISSGIAWVLTAKLFVRSLGLVSTVILARLLVPDDFGLIAIATSIFVISETLTEFGFGKALIKFDEVTDEHLNTAVTLNIVRGILVGICIIATAEYFSQVLGDPRLTGLLVALGILSVLGGSRNVKFVLFEKVLNYKREFQLKFSAKIISVTVTIVAAFTLGDYRALVIGMFVNRGLEILISYWMIPHVPRYSLSKWRELFGFSSWLMLTNLTFVLSSRFYYFIIWKFFGTETAGNFHVGSEVSNYLTSDLVGSLSRVLFPAFSEVSGKKDDLRYLFLQGLTVTMGVGLPIGFGLSVIADDLVLLLLGAKWEVAIPVVQFLSVGMSLTMISSVVYPLLMAVNKTQLLFFREMSYFVLRVISVSFGVWLAGFSGLLYAALIAAIAVLFLNVKIAATEVDRSVFYIMSYFWRPMVASVAMWILLHSISGLLPQPAGAFDHLLRLLVLIPSGAASFVGMVWGAWLLQSRPDGFESRATSLILNLTATLWAKIPRAD
jgi:PST family polysaccharide transporter